MIVILPTVATSYLYFQTAHFDSRRFNYLFETHSEMPSVTSNMDGDVTRPSPQLPTSVLAAADELKYRAKYDFEAENENELTIKKDELSSIIVKGNNGNLISYIYIK